MGRRSIISGGYKNARHIIASHAAEGVPAAGRRVTLRPDALALGGDEGLAALEAAPTPTVGVWDPNRALVFSGDCRGHGSARLAARARAQAGAFGLSLVPPAAGCAIPVLHERGLAGPGDLLAALGLPDGRTSGYGSLVWPVDGAALEGIWERGTFEADVPDIHRLACSGKLAPAVRGADVGLYVAGQFGRGGAAGALLEFGGPVVDGLSRGEREGMAAAAALGGAVAVLCAPETKAEGYDAIFEYDFTSLAPQCARPREGNAGFEVAPLAEISEAFVRRVIIGPAASASELGAATRMLAGRKVHSDVQLWVSPVSRQAHFEALAQGYLMDLIDAGATVLPSCALPWAEELTSDGAAVATTGLCGFEVCRERGVEVYYVSAASAAAAALAGELCDPTSLWKKLESG